MRGDAGDGGEPWRAESILAHAAVLIRPGSSPLDARQPVSAVLEGIGKAWGAVAARGETRNGSSKARTWPHRAGRSTTMD